VSPSESPVCRVGILDARGVPVPVVAVFGCQGHHDRMRSHDRASDPRSGLTIDVTTGLTAAARQVESPNCDDRPPRTVVDLVVVHGISLPPGEFGGPWIDALFTNALPADAHPDFAEIATLRVSAHALIRRDGEIVQYVPFHRRAWHAGQSRWEGRSDCNDFSIGIEIEGTDGTAYESLQYVRLARLIAALSRAYPGVSIDRVVGHSDVAPGRKTDPGPAFDWPLLRALLRFESELGGA
jgi:AmpD protein